MIRERIYAPQHGSDNAGMHDYESKRDPREIIRMLRVERGYASDRALAMAADIPQPTLSRYLSGTNGTMAIGHWMQLADALEVTVSELLGEVPLSPGMKRIARAMERLPARDLETLVALANTLSERAQREQPGGAANDDR